MLAALSYIERLTLLTLLEIHKIHAEPPVRPQEPDTVLIRQSNLFVERSSKDKQGSLFSLVAPSKHAAAAPLYLEAWKEFLEPHGWDLAIKQGLANSIQVSAHEGQPPHCLP